MPAQQLLLHLPPDLVRRLKHAVPARQRSAFISRLLEAALPPEPTDPLYEAALAAENDATLSAEMAEWEHATFADGLAAPASPPTRRR